MHTSHLTLQVLPLAPPWRPEAKAQPAVPFIFAHHDPGHVPAPDVAHYPRPCA